MASHSTASSQSETGLPKQVSEEETQLWADVVNSNENWTQFRHKRTRDLDKKEEARVRRDKAMAAWKAYHKKNKTSLAVKVELVEALKVSDFMDPVAGTSAEPAIDDVVGRNARSDDILQIDRVPSPNVEQERNKLPEAATECVLNIPEITTNPGGIDVSMTSLGVSTDMDGIQTSSDCNSAVDGTQANIVIDTFVTTSEVTSAEMEGILSPEFQDDRPLDGTREDVVAFDIFSTALEETVMEGIEKGEAADPNEAQGGENTEMEGVLRDLKNDERSKDFGEAHIDGALDGISIEMEDILQQDILDHFEATDQNGALDGISTQRSGVLSGANDEVKGKDHETADLSGRETRDEVFIDMEGVLRQNEFDDIAAATSGREDADSALGGGRNTMVMELVLSDSDRVVTANESLVAVEALEPNSNSMSEPEANPTVFVAAEHSEGLRSHMAMAKINLSLDNDEAAYMSALKVISEERLKIISKWDSELLYKEVDRDFFSREIFNDLRVPDLYRVPAESASELVARKRLFRGRATLSIWTSCLQYASNSLERLVVANRGIYDSAVISQYLSALTKANDDKKFAEDSISVATNDVTYAEKSYAQYFSRSVDEKRLRRLKLDIVKATKGLLSVDRDNLVDLQNSINTMKKTAEAISERLQEQDENLNATGLQASDDDNLSDMQDMGMDDSASELDSSEEVTAKPKGKTATKFTVSSGRRRKRKVKHQESREPESKWAQKVLRMDDAALEVFREEAMASLRHFHELTQYVDFASLPAKERKKLAAHCKLRYRGAIREVQSFVTEAAYMSRNVALLIFYTRNKNFICRYHQIIRTYKRVNSENKFYGVAYPKKYKTDIPPRGHMHCGCSIDDVLMEFFFFKTCQAYSTNENYGHKVQYMQAMDPTPCAIRSFWVSQFRRITGLTLIDLYGMDPTEEDYDAAVAIKIIGKKMAWIRKDYGIEVNVEFDDQPELDKWMDISSNALLNLET